MTMTRRNVQRGPKICQIDLLRREKGVCCVALRLGPQLTDPILRPARFRPSPRARARAAAGGRAGSDAVRSLW